MEDLISIIIPVYNVENYLERAVNSVINQTYTNLEIILIDDGSKDNSGLICEEVAKRDKRIKVMHQENSGLSVARNVGIKNATGKYIGFVDSDDLISNKMYEVLYSAIIDNNSKISMCNYIPFYKDSPQFDEFYKCEVMSSDEALKELMIDKKVRNFACNKLFDIELFSNIEFPAGKRFEDIGTTFKLFLKVENLVYVDMRLYGYFVRADSITGNYNTNATLDFIEMINYRYDYLMKDRPDLSVYINLNRVNVANRYFIDIAKSKKLSVLRDKAFKGKLYKELDIAKRLNTKDVKKINDKKSNLLNGILFFNTYVFYFIVKFIFAFTFFKKHDTSKKRYAK